MSSADPSHTFTSDHPRGLVIAAPNADWSRAVAIAIEGVAFVVAIGPVGVGIISRQLTSVMIALVTAAAAMVIVRGVTIGAWPARSRSTSQLASCSRRSSAASPRSTSRRRSPSKPAAPKEIGSASAYRAEGRGFRRLLGRDPVGHALAVIEMLTRRLDVPRGPRRAAHLFWVMRTGLMGGTVSSLMAVAQCEESRAGTGLRAGVMAVAHQPDRTEKEQDHER